MMRLALAIVLSWVAGISSFAIALAVLFHETFKSFESFLSLATWIGFASIVVLPAIYWPVFIVLSRILKGYKPIVVFPLVAMLMGIVPILGLFHMFGYPASDIASSKGGLFLSLFSGFGIAAGLVFAIGRKKTITEIEVPPQAEAPATE